MWDSNHAVRTSSQIGIPKAETHKIQPPMPRARLARGRATTILSPLAMPDAAPASSETKLRIGEIHHAKGRSLETLCFLRCRFDNRKLMA